jgi:phage terminase large subunit
LDFGYNLPTALVKVGHKDGIVWEEELIYETHLTNHQLIERLKTLIPPFLRTRQIVADSAEPDRIEEIYNAGFNIIPCIKGPGSVKVGIDRVKRYRTHVSATSTNLIEEKQSYKWKEDKYGNVLDEPVEYCDHLMDAERYFLGQTPIQQAKLIVLGEYMTG